MKGLVVPQAMMVRAEDQLSCRPGSVTVRGYEYSRVRLRPDCVRVTAFWGEATILPVSKLADACGDAIVVAAARYGTRAVKRVFVSPLQLAVWYLVHRYVTFEQLEAAERICNNSGVVAILPRVHLPCVSGVEVAMLTSTHMSRVYGHRTDLVVLDADGNRL